MLTEKQQKYIALIPETRKAIIKPFNPKGLLVVQEIMEKIKLVIPDLEVKLLGSLALEIAGEEDIDISIFCEKEKWGQYFGEIEKLFGKHNRVMLSSMKWEFETEGFHVDLILIDPNNDFAKRVAVVHGRLENDAVLLKEYENMKISFNGKSYREYQTAKFEFFNKILGI